jgi:hypothetical protein
VLGFPFAFAAIAITGIRVHSPKCTARPHLPASGVKSGRHDHGTRRTGMVNYNRQREAAEQAVAGLAGVRDTRDDVKLSYDADPADVTLLVQAALDRNALIRDDSDISVDTPWQHGDAQRAHPHPGRTRRGGRRRLDGRRRLPGPRDELDITG